MSGAYPVRIFESELRVICDETMDFPDIETGGNLFGSLSHGGSPTVWLATRPDGKFHRASASLELDHVVEYEIEKAVWAQYGIQFLGMWHSHHQIGLYEPSGGDCRRTANYASSARRGFYVEILCNLPQQPYSRNTWMPVTVNDSAYADARAREDESMREADEERNARDDGSQSRKKRKEQAKEKRAVREAAHGPSRLRAGGPVRVAPFVYVDAPRLEQADASFVILPGISPVRQAIAATDLARAFAEAFRPVDVASHEAVRYELATSRASRYRRGYAGSGGDNSPYVGQAGKAGLGTTEVTSGDSVDLRPVSQGQEVPASAETVMDARQTQEDGKALPKVPGQQIPDMARYIEKVVVPLVQSRPQYVSTVDPDGKDKIVLRVSNQYGSRQFLMVLGWNGKAPIVLSCAVIHDGRSPVYPDPADGNSVNGCFYWGVRQL